MFHQVSAHQKLATTKKPFSYNSNAKIKNAYLLNKFIPSFTKIKVPYTTPNRVIKITTWYYTFFHFRLWHPLPHTLLVDMLHLCPAKTSLTPNPSHFLFLFLLCSLLPLRWYSLCTVKSNFLTCIWGMISAKKLQVGQSLVCFSSCHLKFGSRMTKMSLFFTWKKGIMPCKST